MKLEIFEKANRTRIDLIRTYNYVSYKDEFNNKGEFTIKIPTSEQTVQYLTSGNYILFEDGVVGVIKRVLDMEEGGTEITVNGTLTNGILMNRSFLKTTQYYDTIPTIARQMVTDLMINPEDERRQIEFIKLSEDSKYIPVSENKVRKQNTGDKLMTVISEIFLTEDYGFELYPVIKNFNQETGQYSNLDSLEFRILKPVKRTIDNSDGNIPVLFSFDLDNLTSLTYEEDETDYCTIAIVASEGEGQDRKIIEIGEAEKTGIDRIELYVDARDIQSENIETGETISEEELEELMTQRGLEKLSERKRFVCMNGTVNTGSMSYTYKVDFFKGDYVTIYSTNLNRYVNLQITSVSKSISNGVEYMDIEFGYDRMTIAKMFKNKGGAL